MRWCSWWKRGSQQPVLQLVLSCVHHAAFVLLTFPPLLLVLGLALALGLELVLVLALGWGLEAAQGVDLALEPVLEVTLTPRLAMQQLQQQQARPLL